MEAEPFRYSYASAAEMPAFPPQIVGYTPYLEPMSSEVRVFEGADGVATPFEFSGQMNDCGDAFWVARWASESPDVTILATNEVPFISDHSLFEIEPWLLPPAATFGMLGGSICSVPGFVLADAPDGPGTALIDVRVEWQYYDLDLFGTPAGPTDEQAPVTSCDSYTYDDELPIEVCSQGLSVQLFQESLGIDADGYFGPGAEEAVRAFQASVGLPVTGVMDAATWAALGVTANAPFPDLNGDGVVDGSEFPAT